MMRASKTKLNKKKLFENYVAYLIKESDKRVLNERELLTLIAYTEGPTNFLNGIREKLRTGSNKLYNALGYTPNGSIALGPNYTFAQGAEDVQNGLSRVGNKVATTMNNAYDTLNDVTRVISSDGIDAARAIGRGAKRVGNTIKNSTTGKIVRGAFGQAATGVKQALSTASNKIKQVPSNLAHAAISSLAQNPKIRSILSRFPGSEIVSAPDGGIDIKYLNNSKPIFHFPKEILNAPNILNTYSESVIIKQGKRVKQKQIMSDLQEQMLIDYLKYKNKKRKK